MTENHRNTILYALLAVSLLVLFLDRIAFENYYYWALWWYDIMMHFLGGFLVAGIALWVFVRFSHADVHDARRGLYVAIATGVVVGLGWEVFEFVFNFPQPGVTNIIGDMALDLLMDMLGAIAVWAILKKTFSLPPNTTEYAD